MPDSYLLHHLVEHSASKDAERVALTFQDTSLTYGELAARMREFGSAMLELGLKRGERVGIWLDKRLETVVASFGTSAAGCTFVPINPLLKAEQVAYILQDCNVRVMVTTAERLALLKGVLPGCPDLQHVVLTGDTRDIGPGRIEVIGWNELPSATRPVSHGTTDGDMLAILYTSGSTGRPKGVVLSHRNMVTGAKSVSSYLRNVKEDTLLAALPLSFDAGFSQLTTGFHSGARVVLLNYLMPRDVVRTMEKERVTGLTAVPPLWIQLTQIEWPASIGEHLRYFANTGGRMPFETLKALRARLPVTRPYLMYGLTEAFRATYLPPEQADLRPDSIGKAIPNNEVMVLREDGSPCAPNEPGELVQRGPLVAMGYWNDPEKTAERFRPLPRNVGGRHSGLVLDEIAVYSGDTVRMDEEGYLYFIGRRDEMIKTSGYRVSPTEVEEAVYATGLVAECAAFGIDHDTLGQAIVLIATAKGSVPIDGNMVLAACRKSLPAYQVPSVVEIREGVLPRNPNGKIDRKLLSTEYVARKSEAAAA
ncbi:MAG: acyl-CoA ligase (AMP-forming), exosortase A system-associated [Betaproteobacteria bacterium]|nr:acyl-CoA ligase (AMP-forming), exosortase A system-associated [Betaproteobacteria bacterium]